MDIQRYLSNEPVSARPPSSLYRFQKLVRRNKSFFAAAGVGVAALVIGLVLSLYLYVQEKSALKRAVAAEQEEAQLRHRAEQSAVWSQQVSKAGLLLMRQEYDASERALRGVPPHETLVPFYNVFGDVHGHRLEWQQALTNWNWVVQYAPEDHLGYHYLAPLLLQIGDIAGYERCRAEILRRFGNTSDPQIAERLTKDCLILPPSADQSATIGRMADVAGRMDTSSKTWGFNLLAEGFANYRLGHFATAAEQLQKAILLDVGPECRTEAYLILAMAQFRLNELDRSRASFAAAKDILEHKLPKSGNLGIAWNDWIIAHVLMREARALIPETERQDAAAR